MAAAGTGAKADDRNTPPHRRHRRMSSSSSISSTTSSSSLNHLSPKSITSSSSIPFSWEHHPGMPKDPSNPKTESLPLPLPPASVQRPVISIKTPSRSKPRPVASPVTVDPFAVALAHCTKDDDDCDDDDEYDAAAAVMFGTRVSRAGLGRSWRLTGGVGFLDLYGCKSAIAVAETTIMVRRSARGAAAGKTSARRPTARAARR